MGYGIFKTIDGTDIALDRIAFENWLANGDAPHYEPLLTSEEIEQRRNLERLDWIERSSERDRLATAALNLRILKQRHARENSPLLFKALQHAGQQVRILANGIMYEGKPCGRCGMRLRYIHDNHCVACAQAREQQDAIESGRRLTRQQHRENRALAIDAGRSRFHGSACRVCNLTLRYSRSDKCVKCDNTKQLKRVRISSRQAAKAAGLPTFEGVPCKVCGSTLRSTATKKCVACVAKARRV